MAVTIVVNPADHTVVGFGALVERVDAQGEKALIKVHPDGGEGFYYIGTNDRDSYELVEVAALPEDFGAVQYEYDGAFVKA